MFNKMTTFRLSSDGVEILDGDLIKTAAIKLPDGVDYDPDYFYMKVRAVSAGEYFGSNKNHDYFPEKELIAGYKTFLTAHTFKNHENKNVENAIGDVLTTDWNDKMKGIDLLLRVDRRIAPSIVRGFEKGFMTDVSMGCRIDYSVCSICGNKAKTKHEYCEHIKTMRGKIFDDGRKVFEINIGPKFHDISAVLSGAERVAKVTGLLIHGSKIAFNIPNELEKVASFQEEIESFDSIKKIPKIANAIDYSDFDIFEPRKEKMSKQAEVQKIAEIKKEIQGRILGIARDEMINSQNKSVEDLMKTIKLLYTKYWDKSKCREIARNITMIANRNEVRIEVAFHQFLNVADFAGIELSPLEIHDIYHELIGVKTPDIRRMEIRDDLESAPFMDGIDNAIEESPAGGLNLSTLFNSISSVEPQLNNLMPKLTENPSRQLRAIVIRIAKPVPTIEKDLMYSDLMKNVFRPLMPERSAHRRFLISRLERIADGKESPDIHNKIHFMPTRMMAENKMVKQAGVGAYILSGMLHAAYENERIAHFNSDNFEYGLNKFASEIDGDSFDNILNEYSFEKSAKFKYGKRKAIMLGIPTTYAYSALQRARINNGENTSSFNRYLAENPGNAALLQVALAPLLSKHVRKSLAKGIGALKNIDKSLLKRYACEDENNFDKVAEYDKILYNKDMFEDGAILSALNERGYSNQQATSMKYACVLSCMERQDLSDSILLKSALNENDLGEYLKTAKDCIRIEIEKTSSAVGDVGGAVLNGAIMNPTKKSSMIASIPGYALDGLIISKLLGGSDKSKSKK